MDEQKKYNSFVIPRLAAREPGESAPYGKNGPSEEAPLSSHTPKFAEIEIDFSLNQTSSA